MIEEQRLRELHEILVTTRTLSQRAVNAGASVVAVQLDRAAREAEGLIAATTARARRGAARTV
jgi:hypothetical protein